MNRLTRHTNKSRLAIVAIYEWQRLTTAILFDVFGFFLLSVWIFVGSVAGLRSGGLPKGISWFGVVAALLSFSFATGYITKIVWLEESGLGALCVTMGETTPAYNSL